MAMLEKVVEFLERNGVSFTHTVHPLAYTAREVAAAEHLPPREVAKTLVLRDEHGYRMLVLPASRVVDFNEVRAAEGFGHARLATEKELAQLFPDCELGAMPPFGNLFNIPVYLDAGLVGQEHIAFNAGTHRDVIHLRLEDFRELVQPWVVSFAREMTAQHGW